MNNLIVNYEIILNNLKLSCENVDSFSQFRNLKLSNLERMIERSVYNKRRRKLFDYTASIRKHISQIFVEFTDVFIVDSVLELFCLW